MIVWDVSCGIKVVEVMRIVVGMDFIVFYFFDVGSEEFVFVFF